MATKEQLIADAEAKQRAAEILSSTTDNVLTAETREELSKLGFDAAPLSKDNVADRYITLYHAYDGRALPVPGHQLAPRLAQIFPHAREIPAEWRGKRVWHENPQPRPDGGTVLCYFSAFQSDEHKALVRAEGFTPDCRKNENSGFYTQYDADEHATKKHPRRWTAHLRYAADAKSATSTDALLKIVAKALESKE